MDSKSIEIKDYKGLTPLHQASRRGNIEIAKSLLDFGAKMDTSVMLQALSPKMVALLMNYNASLAFQTSEARPAEETISPFEKFMKHQPVSAITILDHAIGTNEYDPDSTSFLITMDLGYFNEIKNRYSDPCF